MKPLSSQAPNDSTEYLQPTAGEWVQCALFSTVGLPPALLAVAARPNRLWHEGEVIPPMPLDLALITYIGVKLQVSTIPAARHVR